MDGHEYVKGNLIYSPSSPCYKCLCDEKFNNATDLSKNANCKPVDCGIELHQLSYLQLGCIPVYFDDGLCCPFEFRCRMCLITLLLFFFFLSYTSHLSFTLNVKLIFIFNFDFQQQRQLIKLLPPQRKQQNRNILADMVI